MNIDNNNNFISRGKGIYSYVPNVNFFLYYNNDNNIISINNEEGIISYFPFSNENYAIKIIELLNYNVKSIMNENIKLHSEIIILNTLLDIAKKH